MTFDELEREVMGLFQGGAYQATYELLVSRMDDFPEQRPFNYYMRVCIAARLEQNKLVFDLLTQAADEDIWFAEAIFRKSPSLQPLQGAAQFEAVVQRHTAMAEMALSEKVVKTAVPLTKPPYPLMLALHGNGSRVDAEFGQWETAVTHGRLVVAPQSSQSFWAGSHSWTDQESAAKEIIVHLDEVTHAYPIDQDNVTVGGFSMGGDVAMWLLLSGAVAAQRFVLVGPGGPYFDDPAKWEPLIAQAAGRDIQGIILYSHDDPHIEPAKIEKTAVLLNNAGFNCELISYTGLAHEYPPDFADRLAAFLIR